MREAARPTRYFSYLIICVVVALLLSVFLPCPPVMAAPVLTIAPSSGPAGTNVTVTGTVFDSYEADTIHILFDTTEISTVTVPESGTFTITAAIPENAASGPHIIGAKRETTDSSFFISTAFSVEERIITLSVAQGPIGTDLTISGSGFCINKTVTLEYYNPAVNNIGSVTASSSGRFSRAYTVPAGIAGNHKITASNDAGNTAEAVFTVKPAMKLSVASASPGEFLNIKGSGFGSRNTVNIYLDSLNAASAPTDDFGSFTADFAIPELERRVYGLKAQDNQGNSVQVDFPVIAGAVLSDNSGGVGSQVTVTGSGYEPGETVTVYYDNQPVASGPADSNGDVSITFNIPPSNGGNHTITIGDSNITRTYPYTVETVPPPSPALLLPANNSVTGAFIHFQWQSVTDASVPVTYNLEVSADSNFSGIVLQKAGITGSQYTLAGEEALAADAADLLYFWRVMAVDGAGNRSTWSDTWSFYLDTPMAPALISPAVAAEVEYPIQLRWEPVASLSQPIAYTLQVSRNAQFSALLLNEKGLDAQEYIITIDNEYLFNKKIPYYWRVRAVDNARNAGKWSDAGSFNIVSRGFPAWAAYTLISLAALVLAVLIIRFIRRRAYH